MEESFKRELREIHGTLISLRPDLIKVALAVGMLRSELSEYVDRRLSNAQDSRSS